jgi:hypothetical protein
VIPTATFFALRFWRAAACAALIGGLSVKTQASPPKEVIRCTEAPKSTWVSEQKIREIFGEKDYAIVKFKISRTNCYEFYAVAKDNSVVEAYYDPVSGKQVRYQRVSIAPESSNPPSTTSSAALPTAR